MLKLIVCVDAADGIAKEGKIPWHIKSDLIHFKETTINHTIVMGHTTYLSIGKPLPNRRNIVFSRNPDLKIEGVEVTASVVDIITMAQHEDVYIIGGQQIYLLFKEYYDELIISRLPTDYNCDLKFNLNLAFYKLTSSIQNAEFTLELYEPIKAKVLYGRPVAQMIQKQLVTKMQTMVAVTKQVSHLVIIQVGSEFASQVYVRNKLKLAEELNIRVTHLQLKETTQTALIEQIKKCNADLEVHGILVQLPLPKDFDLEMIANAIDPLKDVDCFHPVNIGKMWTTTDHSTTNVLPCTPFGVMQLLQHYQIPIEGKQVVIIGRSNIVGKPLASLLLQAHATVQICHSKTHNLPAICQQADILVAAIGKAKFVTKDFIKPGAVVIDIGINHDQNNKACGDVDFMNVRDLVSAISPVPNGVGPMTLIALFYNLLKLYQKQLCL